MEPYDLKLSQKTWDYLEELHKGKIISWEENRPIAEEIRDKDGNCIKLIPSDITTLTIAIRSKP